MTRQGTLLALLAAATLAVVLPVCAEGAISTTLGPADACCDIDSVLAAASSEMQSLASDAATRQDAPPRPDPREKQEKQLVRELELPQSMGGGNCQTGGPSGASPSALNSGSIDLPEPTLSFTLQTPPRDEARCGFRAQMLRPA